MASERSWLQHLQQTSAATWLLAVTAGWALLLWLATLLGMGTRLAPLPPETGGALPQVQVQSAHRVGALAQYASAAERPLFTENRRPHAFLASAAGNDGDAMASSFDFLLTGVLISPQLRMVMLQPSGGGDTQRVREGAEPEGASGWRLVDVQPRRAVFEGPGGQTTLELRTFGTDGRTAAPAVVADAMGTQAPVDDPPPPPPPVDAARVDDIRRRIEARRAQLKQQESPADHGVLRPLSGPNK